MELKEGLFPVAVAMARHQHPRIAFLLLIAIVAPCSVLVFLGLRMMQQERELVQKRLVEERQRLVLQIARELLDRLEKIRLREEGTLGSARSPKLASFKPGEPAVVFIARVENGRIVPPWEENPSIHNFLQLAAAGEFGRAVQQGERDELREGRFIHATGSYREALALAKQPVQRAYARLLLARSLLKAGRSGEAREQYRHLLQCSSSLVDDQGMPFKLYAARQLLELGGFDDSIFGYLASVVEEQQWLAPVVFHAVGGLTESLAAKPLPATVLSANQKLSQKVMYRIREAERILALQSNFLSLLSVQASAEGPLKRAPVWIPHGEPLWLINLTSRSREGPPFLLAVDAEPTFRSLDAVISSSKGTLGEVHLATQRDLKGHLLGEPFPGLKVDFAELGNPFAMKWNAQKQFYLAVVIVVVTLTALGAYLVWRDVRRELHIADLRTEFVSHVSHELKTPLTAIRMFAETLQMGRFKDAQTQSEYLEAIVSESERLTRLVNNVLEFSKIEQARKIYQARRVRLAEVVQAAAGAVQYHLQEKDFQLKLTMEEDLPTVLADADALEQALLNLLTNAMKYSGEAREIELKVRRTDGMAVLQVTDHGLGIPQEEQKRIFEKFYRVSSQHNQGIPGTGLGLTLVEHFVKAHGGEVKVESQPGQGSTFSICLPLEV